MEPTFFNPDMPIGAFVEACKERLGYLEAQLRSIQEERQSLIQFLGGFGQLEKTAKTLHIMPASIPPPLSAMPATDTSPTKASSDNEKTMIMARRELEALRDRERHEALRDRERHEALRARERHEAMVAMRMTLENSSNERILAHVAGLLSDGRKKTSDLIVMLNSAGLTLNSPNQQGLLSTLMSKDGRFVASRKFGWGLKGRDDEDGEPEEEE